MGSLAFLPPPLLRQLFHTDAAEAHAVPSMPGRQFVRVAGPVLRLGEATPAQSNCAVGNARALFVERACFCTVEAFARQRTKCADDITTRAQARCTGATLEAYHQPYQRRSWKCAVGITTTCIWAKSARVTLYAFWRWRSTCTTAERR